MYDAIADGLRTPGLLAKIEGLEGQKTELEAKLDAPSPSPVRLHPNLADFYRQKTAALCDALADPNIRDEAFTILRGLIEEVRLGFGPEGWTAELQGEITSLVALGMQNDRAPRPGLGVEAHCSPKVVAGARNHRERKMFKFAASTRPSSGTLPTSGRAAEPASNETFDRALRVLAARFTGGLSPHAAAAA